MLRSIFCFSSFFVFFVFASEAQDRERSHRLLELKLEAIETRITGIESKLNRLANSRCQFDEPESDSSSGGPTSCAEGWVMSPDNTCLKFSTERKSWQSAYAQCRLLMSDLVTVENNEMNDFLSTRVTDDAWLGLNDRDEEGNFKWSHEDWRLTGFTHWEAGSPRPRFDAYDCVFLQEFERRPDAKWVDAECEGEKFFVCERRGANQHSRKGVGNVSLQQNEDENQT